MIYVECLVCDANMEANNGSDIGDFAKSHEEH